MIPKAKMKNSRPPFWISLVFFLALSFPVLSNSIQPENSFNDLLDEAGLLFQTPENYQSIDVKQTETFPHEYAIRSADRALEIRYVIRPLARIEIDYEDPHNSAPEPNHIFTMMFTALIGHLSSGGNSPHREYQTDHAQKQFNADWAAISVFDVEREYTEDYKQAFLIAMHKNNISDAYLVILFNDYKTVKPMLETAMKSLRYK